MRHSRLPWIRSARCNIRVFRVFARLLASSVSIEPDAYEMRPESSMRIYLVERMYVDVGVRRSFRGTLSPTCRCGQFRDHLHSICSIGHRCHLRNDLNTGRQRVLTSRCDKREREEESRGVSFVLKCKMRTSIVWSVSHLASSLSRLLNTSNDRKTICDSDPSPSARYMLA